MAISISYAYCQDTQWVLDTVKKYEVPLGYCNWTDLENKEFFAEMQEQYQNYNPNESALEKMAQLLTNQTVHIDVFFGAWCGDSREHVPHLIKIINNLEHQFNQHVDFQLIGCDRDKNSGIISDIEIEYVPTFVIYRTTDSVTSRVGTIVESPEKTLEEDLLNILQQ